MLNAEVQNPFHAGELEAQTRAGVGNVAKWAGGFIRDFMPAQHRNFYTSLPFLVMSRLRIWRGAHGSRWWMAKKVSFSPPR